MRYTGVYSLFTCLLLLLAPRAAHAQDYLLFCNNPEKIKMAGIHADALLRGGKTYTIFYHYKNVTSGPGQLVLALNGDKGQKLGFTARKGFADPHWDPPLAGRQAMARYLSSGDTRYSGKKGAARFSYTLGRYRVASGLLTVRADSDTRLRIYYRHSKWSVPGAKAIFVEAPRRDIPVTLSKGNSRLSFRIGQPEAGMHRGLDGTYGMLYAFKVNAPTGRRLRVSFSPRGGKSGLVGSVNGAMRQSSIVPATQWKVFYEAIVGKNGLTLTTSPFGGVFYPVEVVFQLI